MGFKPPIRGLWAKVSTIELFDLLMNEHKMNVDHILMSLFTN